MNPEAIRDNELLVFRQDVARLDHPLGPGTHPALALVRRRHLLVEQRESDEDGRQAGRTVIRMPGIPSAVTAHRQRDVRQTNPGHLAGQGEGAGGRQDAIDVMSPPKEVVALRRMRRPLMISKTAQSPKARPRAWSSRVSTSQCVMAKGSHGIARPMAKTVAGSSTERDH